MYYNEKIESLREAALKLASDLGIDIEIPENPSEEFLENLIEWLGRQSYVKENPVQ